MDDRRTDTMSNNNRPDDPDAMADMLDVLIARIVDGEADEHDWEMFNTLAESAPSERGGAWKRLAECHRDTAQLALAVSGATAVASRIGLPVRAGSSAGDGMARGIGLPVSGRRGGWAVAAAIGLAWIGSTLTFNRASAPSNQNAAGLLPAHWTINNPDDAVKAYLDVGQKSGRVLGEVPERVIVRTVPVQNPAGAGGPAGRGSSRGQVEVYYLRQFVERAVVSDLVKFGTDEAGNAVPVRMPIQRYDLRSE
jgi:hypothetical protein